MVLTSTFLGCGMDYWFSIIFYKNIHFEIPGFHVINNLLEQITVILHSMSFTDPMTEIILKISFSQ